jgi:phage shock protein PspC (stress-responsive transcriptional regulator)
MPRRLTRDPKNAALGGVAAGLGDYFGVDPVLARLVFVLLALMNGVGVVAYVVCWLVMPRRDQTGADATPADRVADEVRKAGERLADEIRSVGPVERRGRVAAGAMLIVLGALFLLDRVWVWHWPHWLRPATLWPIVLMIIGASIIWQALRGTGK